MMSSFFMGSPWSTQWARRSLASYVVEPGGAIDGGSAAGARPLGGGEWGLVAPLVFKTSGTGTPRPVGSIPATSATSANGQRASMNGGDLFHE